MLSVSMEASTSLIAPTEAAAAEVDANRQALEEPRSRWAMLSVAIDARELSMALVVGGVTAAGQVLEDPERGSAAMSSVSMEASTSLIALTEAAVAEVDANGQVFE